MARSCISLYLSIICISIFTNCKQTVSDLDGVDRFGSGASRFIAVQSFAEEIAIGLTSFQLRKPGAPDECFYPGTAKYSACDGVAHFIVSEAKGDRYKFRFLPGPNDLCLGDYDSLKLISCESADAWMTALQGGNSSWKIGKKYIFMLYRSVSAPDRIGIEESRDWQTKTVDGLAAEFWEYAIGILADPKTWSPVTYTEMAPAIAGSSTQPVKADKKVAWWRNNDKVCDGICGGIGKVCAAMERTPILRGSLKRVHATCTNDYDYFSNKMNDETIRKLSAVTFSYAKNSDNKESLVRILTEHDLALGHTMSTSFGCAVSVSGCRTEDLVTIRVDTTQQVFRKLWIGTDHDSGHVGTIFLESLDGQVYKVNSKSNQLQAAQVPAGAVRPDNRTAALTSPVELDPKDFLTRDQRKLFDVLGSQKPDEDMVYPAGRDYIKDFAMPTANLEAQINLNYALAGFYGFSTGDKIASLGGVFIDTARDDLQSISADGLIGFTKRGGQMVGQTDQEMGAYSRQYYDFDTMVETSVRMFGVIRSLSFSAAEKDVEYSKINALRALSIHYDLTEKIDNQVVDIGTSNQSDFNILGSNHEDEATTCPEGAGDCKNYRLCRVEYRHWPKVAHRYYTSNPSDRYKVFLEPKGVANTGAIHSLRFTFAKRDAAGHWTDQTFSVAAGASDEQTVDDFSQDPGKQSWQNAFPFESMKPGVMVEGQCSSVDRNEVTGLFGQVGKKVETDDWQNPPVIAKIGFYFGIPLGVPGGNETVGEGL
ncbi:MAG: hypothetical protein CMP10_20805 [Zetaproteobacteria bacterium]|nr:hypothetical protein [Pseudobdellovibrionaceae bacterium]